MDALAEDFARSDMDGEMTVLTREDENEQELSEEVESLQNSLREAVHDENVQPKMQCLMMDASFSMVTVQGEDSGIAWETGSSRCTTPWASDAAADLSPAVAVRPATPGSHPAGKIIFVMDDELMSRKKKMKERLHVQRSKADRQRELLLEDDDISGRPELVEFSQPNVKPEGGGDEEEPTDREEDKEQQLFSLVSDGSEILNIVVPPKFASVDEEESNVLVDNLSYLEETPTKSSNETFENVLDLNDEWETSIGAPTESGSGQEMPSSTVHPHVMDPPGAPVARSRGMGATGNVDYFEAFNPIEVQAPGGPAVTVQGEEEQQAEEASEAQDIEQPVLSHDKSATVPSTVDDDTAETASILELSSDLLDEVFYGGTDTYSMKSPNESSEAATSRLPLKESGSALFGSQEDILTPIYLPEGPAKIIDPILLEEPKALAFLYTDLYEEACGSRMKEEDTESMTSEKSFHSRHSDREARGYLEKYALIDETPVVETEPSDAEQCPEEGLRILSQDLFEFVDPDMGEIPKSMEEVTDFFRTCDNSSPCDIDPFPQTWEVEEAQPITKRKAKTPKNVSIATEKAVENPIEPLADSDEPDWGSTLVDFTLSDEGDYSFQEDQELCKPDLESQIPIAPPRRKAKSCLDLTTLTPVEITEGKQEGGGKEDVVEEKETASPAETANDGEGEGYLALFQDKLLEFQTTEFPEIETAGDTEPAAGEDGETLDGQSDEQTEPQDTELAEAEKQAAPQVEPTKDKGSCVIL